MIEMNELRLVIIGFLLFFLIILSITVLYVSAKNKNENY